MSKPLQACPKPLDQCRLYAFVDEAYRAGRRHEDLAEALCQGGADIIQLRMKGQPHATICRVALALFPITQAHGVHLIINDDVATATGLPSPFLHLGQEDFFDEGYLHVDELRSRTACRSLKLGISTHAPSQAQRAIQAGADYVAIGPVFATPTKPSASPVTLDYVRWASAEVQIPWFCIGGIKQNNLTEVLNAGARRICVVSDILNHKDPESQCRWFRSVIEQYPLPHQGTP